MPDATSHHAAILALVDEYIASADADDYPVRFPLEALRRVVELHHPEDYWRGAKTRTGEPFPADWRCTGDEFGGYDGERPDWPCETVTRIAGALGVDLNG